MRDILCIAYAVDTLHNREAESDKVLIASNRTISTKIFHRDTLLLLGNFYVYLCVKQFFVLDNSFFTPSPQILILLCRKSYKDSLFFRNKVTTTRRILMEISTNIKIAVSFELHLQPLILSLVGKISWKRCCVESLPVHPIVKHIVALPSELERRKRKEEDAILPTCFGYRCKQREDSGVNLGEVDSSGEKELVPA